MTTSPRKVLGPTCGLACALLLVILLSALILSRSNGEDAPHTELRRVIAALLVDWEACAGANERAFFCAELDKKIGRRDDPGPSLYALDYDFVERSFRAFTTGDSASQQWSAAFFPRPGIRPRPSYFVSQDGSVYRGRTRAPRGADAADVLRRVRREISAGEWRRDEWSEGIFLRMRYRHIPARLETVGPPYSGRGPLVRTLTVRNRLSTEIAFPSRPGGGSPDPYEIDTPSGQPVPLKAGPVPEGDLVRLPAGETWSGTITLSDYFAVGEPGRYRCRILLPVTFTNDQGNVFHWEVPSNQTEFPLSLSPSSAFPHRSPSLPR